MASAKAIALMESIYARVDKQVRDIMATLPGVTVPAQQDGSVVSAQRRIYNFVGAGVVVSDDPTRRRVNIHIPGALADSDPVFFVSTTAAEKVMDLGDSSGYTSDPANWQTNAFVDTAWANSQNNTANETEFPLSGATWINFDNTSSFPQSQVWLMRRTFAIDAGSITDATLQVAPDSEVLALYVNGTSLGTAGPFDGALYGDIATFTVPPSLLVTGASNLIAMKIRNGGTGMTLSGTTAVQYRLDINMVIAGADARYQLLSEKDQDLGYAGLDADGLVSDAALADSGTPGAGTFLRGDRSWSAVSANSISVQDIDATPTVTATTIEFPNGTVTDEGGGVARYTPASAGVVSYVNIQDQKAQNTQGGTFTSGSFQTRTLNTEVSDADGIAALSSNQIVLSAGTYQCSIVAMALGCDVHKARLQNVTAGTTLLSGLNHYADPSSSHSSPALLNGQFTIAASQSLEVQHRCNATKSTNGFGVANNYGTEVYLTVEFWKVA